MKDYSNILFSELTEQIRKSTDVTIGVEIIGNDFISLQYFLTSQFYYAVIVDDYLFEINDKESLLEALYYQVKLITVHSLNWDAIQEGLSDALNNFLDFEGICLLFKNGNQLKSKLPKEFKMLSEIIADINKQSQEKQIKILINL